MKKTTIIFYQLHPVNMLPALIASIFFRVVYWRSYLVPRWLLNRFEQIYQHGSFTQEEWALKTKNIFFELKKIWPKNKYNKRVFFQYDGQSIDVTNAAMQNIVMKYERVKHLYLLIDYWLDRQPENSRYFVVDFLENKNLNDISLSAEDNKYPTIYLLNSYFDILWGGVLNVLQACNEIKHYFLPTSSPKYDYSQEKIKLYWYCLSFNEIASKKDAFDVTNIVRKGKINAEESIFILPIIPNRNQKKWYLKNRIKWVYEGDVCKFNYQKISLIDMFRLLKITFGFKVFSGEKALIRQIKCLFIRRIMMLNHFIHTGASTLVTGQSHGLIENPIVSVARALEKKTIWWSYSGQTSRLYTFLKSDKYFFEQTEEVEEAITLSEKKCVWNEFDKNILLARNLVPKNEAQTKLTVTGALMSGNPKWVKLDPNKARQKYNGFNGNNACKLWITIFDTPVFRHDLNIMHRWPIGLITENIEKQFFKDIQLLLEKYQHIGIIYKPKRRKCKKFLESNEKMNLFSDKNPLILSGRLIKLCHNVDPYIAIALGDVAIAMPYTSALFAAISFQRDGVYYNPSSAIKSASPDSPDIVKTLTINSLEGLYAKVELWLKGHRSCDKSLLKLIECKDDPIKNFTSLL